jgi:hypothetical protein
MPEHPAPHEGDAVPELTTSVTLETIANAEEITVVTRCPTIGENGARGTLRVDTKFTFIEIADHDGAHGVWVRYKLPNGSEGGKFFVAQEYFDHLSMREPHTAVAENGHGHSHQKKIEETTYAKYLGIIPSSVLHGHEHGHSHEHGHDGHDKGNHEKHEKHENHEHQEKHGDHKVDHANASKEDLYKLFTKDTSKLTRRRRKAKNPVAQGAHGKDDHHDVDASEHSHDKMHPDNKADAHKTPEKGQDTGKEKHGAGKEKEKKDEKKDAPDTKHHKEEAKKDEKKAGKSHG